MSFSKQPTNTTKKKRRNKIKLRLPLKNPYGDILTDWPNKKELDSRLKRGPRHIAEWQKIQTTEILMVPQLNTSFIIPEIINKLQILPSELFAKMYFKLEEEFLKMIEIHSSNYTFNSNNNTTDIYNNQHNKKLNLILKNSLRFIRVPEFWKINHEILLRIDPIPTGVKKILCLPSNIDIFNGLSSIVIKRQIWEERLDLFDVECNEIFSDYAIIMKQKHEQSFTNEKLLILKQLRSSNNSALKTLSNIIGSSAVLLVRCLSNIRQSFLKIILQQIQHQKKRSDFLSSLVAICNLRLDICQCLKEHAHQQLIMDCDSIYKYVQIIDECMVNHKMSILQINELFSIYNKCKIQIAQKLKQMENENKVDNFVIDCGMLLCLPKIRSILCFTLIQTMKEIAHMEILPKNNRSITILISMLNVSCHPIQWFLKCKCMQFPMNANVDRNYHSLISKYLPLLSFVIHFDDIFGDYQSKKLVENDEFYEMGSFSSNILQFCKTNNICFYVLLYYLLDCLQNRRIGRCLEIIQCMMDCKMYEFVHLLFMNGLNEICGICQCFIEEYEQHKLDANENGIEDRDKTIIFSTESKILIAEFLHKMIGYGKKYDWRCYENKIMRKSFVHFLEVMDISENDQNKFLKM